MGEASGKLWFVQELKIGKSLLLFFVRPAKKQRAIKIKFAQTHFRSVLGHHTSYRKKLSKNLLSWGNLVLQKKEPRKARFPWDLGLLFGKSMRCALLLQNMKI